MTQSKNIDVNDNRILTAMLANFLLIPMANFVLDLSGSTNTIPLIELETMMPVLMGMLGLGAMRSFEKVKKVSREN